LTAASPNKNGTKQRKSLVSSYGKRVDGTEKGSGWLGELKMKDGSNRIMTEFSAGFEVNGKEVEMPTIVPTLSEEELNHLLQGGKPTKQIYDKAYKHGMERIKSGESPFKNSGKGKE
jgi:hypothetical protein